MCLKIKHVPSSFITFWGENGKTQSKVGPESLQAQTTNPQMTRGPPVRHELPWKTFLPLSLAEQPHKDDLTRSMLCKLTRR